MSLETHFENIMFYIKNPALLRYDPKPGSIALRAGENSPPLRKGGALVQGARWHAQYRNQSYVPYIACCVTSPVRGNDR